MKRYEYDLSIAVTITVEANTPGEAERLIRSAPFGVRARHPQATVTEEASLESWNLTGVTNEEESK